MDPARHPTWDPDVEEPFERTEDLDLIAAIEPAELGGANVVRLGVEADEARSDGRTLHALAGRLREHAPSRWGSDGRLRCCVGCRRRGERGVVRYFPRSRFGHVDDR